LRLRDACDLVERFLQIVFAECQLTGGHRIEHRLCREGLRYGQQLDLASGAFRCLYSIVDCRFDSLQVPGDYGHNDFL